MRPIRHSVYELLMRQALEPKWAATQGSGIGDGERSRESALSHQPTGEGEPRSMGMGKTGAAKAPASALERQEREPTPQVRRVSLTVVASNKCLSRATPMRGPRNALDRHLSLVWSV